MTRPTTDIAVLTGDLKDSSRAAPEEVDDAMAALARAAGDVGRWEPAGDPRFTRFRGDGWQIRLKRPAEEALRAALYLAARLRAAPSALATRIAIGIGTEDFAGSDSLADARGTAFEHSGRALDGIGPAMLTIAGDHVRPLQNTLLRILGERIQRWSPEQAEATAIALDPAQLTLEAISRQLGISKQAVSYRLGGAGFPALRQSLKEWEADQSAALKRKELS